MAGKNDCYGLARNFYREFYNLELTDFARPEGFWNPPAIDIISEMLHVDGWREKAINPRMLKEGDALVFSLLQTGMPNHIGVYLGNSMFMHHVQDRLSVDEALLPKWTNRLLMVLEHQVVTQARELNRPKIDFTTTLPDNVRRQILGDA